MADNQQLVIADPKAPGALCGQCPLLTRACAPSSGPKDAKAFILSRSPGYYDTLNGRPFSGPSGKLLDHLLRQNGISRKDVFTTNIVLCETDDPPEEAIEACAPRLDHELSTVKADVYLAAGAEANTRLTGRPKLRDSRGRQHDLVGNVRSQAKVVSTYNPAAALRDDGVFPDLVQDFRLAFNPIVPARLPSVEIYEDERSAKDRISQLLAHVSRGNKIACDIESTGLSVWDDVLSIGIAPDADTAYTFSKSVLHLFHGDNDGGKLLSKSGACIWHNGQFDVRLLRSNGYPAELGDDTLLLSYSRDERAGVHSLDHLATHELGWHSYESDAVKLGKKYQFRTDPLWNVSYYRGNLRAKLEYEGFVEWEDLWRYNALDASATFKLYEILLPIVKNERTYAAYQQILLPAARAFVDIESYGLLFDEQEALNLLVKEVTPQLKALHEQAAKIVGHPINLNSPKQVSDYLYDTAKIENPVFRRGKDRSVDSVVREELLLQPHLRTEVRDFVETLDRFKKLDKLRGTYLEGMFPRVDRDGRVRTSLLLHGTETGRLSSRGPNLQNIPREGKFNLPDIRRLFRAPPGRTFIQADYSQAELRVAAMLSQDQGLLNIYRNGLDLHTEVATTFYGEDFTKEHRTRAKNVNFGILYGIGAFKLSQMLRIEVDEAQRLIDEWWRKFPDVKKWVNKVHHEARTQQSLYSVYGRRRRFHLITKQNLDHTLKEAVNFLVQSTASDLTLLSGLSLHQRLDGDGRVCLLVHDSILIECEESDKEKVMGLAVKEMEVIPTTTLGWTEIPFRADVTYGPSWGEQSK